MHSVHLTSYKIPLGARPLAFLWKLFYTRFRRDDREDYPRASTGYRERDHPSV